MCTRTHTQTRQRSRKPQRCSLLPLAGGCSGRAGLSPLTSASPGPIDPAWRGMLWLPTTVRGPRGGPGLRLLEEGRWGSGGTSSTSTLPCSSPLAWTDGNSSVGGLGVPTPTANPLPTPLRPLQGLLPPLHPSALRFCGFFFSSLLCSRDFPLGAVSRGREMSRNASQRFRSWTGTNSPLCCQNLCEGSRATGSVSPQAEGSLPCPCSALSPSAPSEVSATYPEPLLLLPGTILRH